MMKRFRLYKVILIILALCGLSYGQQFTNVTATIQDPSGQVWTNAIITVNLIPAFQKPGPPVNQGHPITDNLQYVQANGSGVFTVTVDDNTFVTPSGSQWAFTVCSNTSAQCNTVTMTISGVSLDISASINAAIKNPVVNAVPTILRAYNAVEATGGNGALYWRTTDNTLWGCYALPNQICQATGGTWIQIGTGGGGGSVVSVGLAGPTGIIITNSPVTTSGVLTWSMPTGWNTGSLLVGNGANSVTNLPIGAANTVLESDGTTAHWQSLMFPAIFYQHVGVNGTTETQRDRLNLIAGTGISITGVDNSGSNSTDVTITNTGTSPATFPDVKEVPAANCNNTSAGNGWSLPATNAPTLACRAGTNNLGGVLQWVNNNTTTNAQFDYSIPGDWDTAIQPYIKIFYASGSNTTGTVKWTFSTACSKSDGSITDDPTFIAETTTTGNTMAAANRDWAESIQFTHVTNGNNCIPGGTMIVLITSGNGTATSAINISKANITFPRTLTMQAN